MKTEDLKAILENAELSIEEKTSKIQALNGVDVNTEKEKNAGEIAKLKEQVSTQTAKIKEMDTNASKYADYEELKEFKAKALEKEEENRKIDFLKSQGCKYPELFVGKVDFTKGKYNEDKKTYEGLDDALKGLKDGYKGMFENKPGAQSINPGTDKGSNDDMSGVEKAFYEANPHLMPKN